MTMDRLFGRLLGGGRGAHGAYVVEASIGGAVAPGSGVPGTITVLGAWVADPLRPAGACLHLWDGVEAREVQVAVGETFDIGPATWSVDNVRRDVLLEPRIVVDPEGPTAPGGTNPPMWVLLRKVS